MYAIRSYYALICGGSLKAVILSSWKDLGSPWDLLTANEHLLSSLSSCIEGEIEDGVVLKGAVKVGKGT